MRWLMWIMSWQSKQPALIRWLEVGFGETCHHVYRYMFWPYPLTFYPDAHRYRNNRMEGRAGRSGSLGNGGNMSFPTGRYVATACGVVASRRLHDCHYRWAEETGSGAFRGQRATAGTFFGTTASRC